MSFYKKCLLNIYADAVLLQNVQTLTLYRGRYTTARRSSPVPQLKCVGGSAGCHAFVPEVVQCQNRGWDGVDVQVRCDFVMLGFTSTETYCSCPKRHIHVMLESSNPWQTVYQDFKDSVGFFKGQSFVLKKADWWNTKKHTSVHPTCLRSLGLQFAYLIYYNFTFRNVAKKERLLKGKGQQGPGPFEHFFFLV